MTDSLQQDSVLRADGASISLPVSSTQTSEINMRRKWLAGALVALPVLASCGSGVTDLCACSPVVAPSVVLTGVAQTPTGAPLSGVVAE